MANDTFIDDLLKPQTEKEIDRIVKMYARTHNDLLKMAKGIKPYSTSANTYSINQKQATIMLSRMQEVLDKTNGEAEKRFKKLFPKLAREGHEFGLKNIEKLGVEPFEREMGVYHNRAVEAAIRLTTMQLKNAGQNIVNYMKLGIDTALDNVNAATAQYLQKTSETIIMNTVGQGLGRRNASEQFYNELIRAGMKAKIKSNGHKMNLKHYAKVVIRSNAMQTYNTANIMTLQDNGFDLIKISSHTNPCKICKQYEDNIYSLSGNHSRFPSVKTISHGRVPGNFHPGCRHVAMPYLEKFHTKKARTDEQKAIDKFITIDTDF